MDAEPLVITDLSGARLTLTTPMRRVVSLVPSVTETLFALDEGASLVGRTRYCIHPAPAVSRIETLGGTKDPNLDRIVELAPDLVLANREENRAIDVAALRNAGVPVHVSEPTNPDEALELVALLGTMLDRIEAAAHIVLDGESTLHALRSSRAEAAQTQSLRLNAPGPLRTAVFIWRDPWMVVGRDTYIGGMVHELDGVNVFADASQRYFETTLLQVAEHDPQLVLLPDEPYRFDERHRAEVAAALSRCEAARTGRIHVCNGEDLMWFGSRTPAALRRLKPLFA